MMTGYSAAAAYYAARHMEAVPDKFPKKHHWTELPPLTLEEAINTLVDETIWALHNRPHDFRKTDRRLIDRKGIDWWISNEEYGLSPFDGPLGNTQYGMESYDVGKFNRARLWSAIKNWLSWKENEEKRVNDEIWRKRFCQAAMDTWVANRPEK